MYIPDWKIEQEYWQRGYQLVVGIDEAGRGPLAGPVVASAVTVKKEAYKIKDKLWDLIRDSKKLSALQRERAFSLIKKHFWVGVGISSEKTIDRINILEATFLAMKKAWTDLQRQIKNNLDLDKTIILIDGNQIIPNFSSPQKAIKNGDNLIKSIAGSSIVAKVMRDRIMKKYAQKFPQYGFEKHKGYGTQKHMEALQKYGPTPIHRFSFKPVKKLIGVDKSRKM